MVVRVPVWMRPHGGLDGLCVIGPVLARSCRASSGETSPGPRLPALGSSCDRSMDHGRDFHQDCPQALLRREVALSIGHSFNPIERKMVDRPSLSCPSSLRDQCGWVKFGKVLGGIILRSSADAYSGAQAGWHRKSAWLRPRIGCRVLSLCFGNFNSKELLGR